MAVDIYVKNARGRRASKASINYSGDEDAGKRRRPSLVSVLDGLSIVNVIRKKRDGEELSDNEIEWFVSATTDRLITEAQIGT